MPLFTSENSTELLNRLSSLSAPVIASVAGFHLLVFFWLMGVGRIKEEDAHGNLWVENCEPICAGLIAGTSLMGIADMLVSTFLL